MIVCLCEGLSEKALRSRIRDGAHSVAALARRTGAGRSCGSCACDLKRLVSEERGGARCTDNPPMAAK